MRIICPGGDHSKPSIFYNLSRCLGKTVEVNLRTVGSNMGSDVLIWINND